MFGTAKEISAELFREYHYDEPLAVLIWDTQSLWYALAKYNPTNLDVLAILESIGCMAIDDYQRSGIGQSDMVSIQEARDATPCVSVDAQALETVVSLAALAIDADDPLSKEGEFIDDMAAIEKVRTALSR
ncbi:DUF1380 family protein [Serratia marcescens]